MRTSVILNSEKGGHFQKLSGRFGLKSTTATFASKYFSKIFGQDHQ
jgi:hypothetical protein